MLHDYDLVQFASFCGDSGYRNILILVVVRKSQHWGALQYRPRHVLGKPGLKLMPAGHLNAARLALKWFDDSYSLCSFKHPRSKLGLSGSSLCEFIVQSHFPLALPSGS